MPETVLRANFMGNRRIGRPNKRWEDGIREDATSLLKCCNWKLAAQNRNVWRLKRQVTVRT
ncbi:hypothetical protein C0J52_03826 [Blattella germanica]|nr:hypothetical protein C0J52_03826 [Blattella germanica]